MIPKHAWLKDTTRPGLKIAVELFGDGSGKYVKFYRSAGAWAVTFKNENGRLTPCKNQEHPALENRGFWVERCSEEEHDRDNFGRKKK